MSALGSQMLVNIRLEGRPRGVVSGSYVDSGPVSSGDMVFDNAGATCEATASDAEDSCSFTSVPLHDLRHMQRDSIG